jgi:hypothetical protein
MLDYEGFLIIYTQSVPRRALSPDGLYSSTYKYLKSINSEMGKTGGLAIPARSRVGLTTSTLRVVSHLRSFLMPRETLAHRSANR